MMGSIFYVFIIIPPLKTAVLLDIYPYIISFPSKNGNFTRVLSPFLPNPNGFYSLFKGGGADVGLCWPRDVLQHGARVWVPSSGGSASDKSGKLTS
jgi:hypothetical protein